MITLSRHHGDIQTPPLGRVNELVIEHLALDNSEMRDRIIDLEADNRRLRELVYAGLDVSQRLTAKVNQQREQIARLREHNNALVGQRGLFGKAA